MTQPTQFRGGTCPASNITWGRSVAPHVLLPITALHDRNFGRVAPKPRREIPSFELRRPTRRTALAAQIDRLANIGRPAGPVQYIGPASADRRLRRAIGAWLR